jgi:hypothetical protein
MWEGGRSARQECYDLNNFPSMLQIMLAVVSSSIDRLRSTWQVRSGRPTWPDVHDDRHRH